MAWAYIWGGGALNRKHAFDYRAVCVGFVLEKLTLEHSSSMITRGFSSKCLSTGALCSSIYLLLTLYNPRT